MHVLLAGATGVLGRRILPRLVALGYEVTAVTRNSSQVPALRAIGATPAVADVLDADALAAVLRTTAPDTVMHQLTDLRDGSRAANARLRELGTRNLVDAARAVGVRRIIAQSIAWAYVAGDRPATEDTPLRADMPGVPQLEAAVRELPEWVVLRYGLLYGPETWYAQDGLMAARARAGELAVDDDITSFVHVDDAAAAALEALTWPTGATNVCDDEPAPGRAWVPAFCRAVGAPPPPTSAVAGPRTGWARGADNRRAHALGWAPRYTSWRDGFAAMARLSGRGPRGAGRPDR
jgi:nucleoside-diphosphate-sugar epimerase